MLTWNNDLFYYFVPIGDLDPFGKLQWIWILCLDWNWIWCKSMLLPWADHRWGPRADHPGWEPAYCPAPPNSNCFISIILAGNEFRIIWFKILFLSFIFIPDSRSRTSNSNIGGGLFLHPRMAESQIRFLIVILHLAWFVINLKQLQLRWSPGVPTAQYIKYNSTIYIQYVQVVVTHFIQ